MFLCWPLRSSSHASAGCVGPRDGCAAEVDGSATTPARAVPTAARRARKVRRGAASCVEVLMVMEAKGNDGKHVCSGVRASTTWRRPQDVGTFPDMTNLTTHALALAAAVAVLAAPASAQSGSPQPAPALTSAIRARVDSIATQEMKARGAPSISLAIVKDGAIAYTNAYGLARLEPPTRAVPSMRYSIGSVSKQFTATAILMLAEEGKLSLDEIGR